MATKKKTSVGTELKARSTERSNDMALLKSMVERTSANASREPEFVFQLDRFVQWVRSLGYTVGDLELSYWKRVAKGLEHPRWYRTRRNSVESRQPGRVRASARSRFDGMGKEEARSRLFSAFQKFESGKKHWDFIDRTKDAIKALGFAPFRPNRAQKVEIPLGDAVPSTPDTLASEGYIDKTEPLAPTRLPESPPMLWIPRRAGRPSASEAGRLIKFIEDVYGPYIANHRTELRSYLYNKDRALYHAITAYERREPLPTHIAMPDRNDRYVARMKQAEAVGFQGMTPRQRAQAELALKLARQQKTQKLRPE